MKPVGLVDPRTGAAPLRRRAAPPGQPRGQPLLDRGVPDAAQVGRAEARLPDDPRPREGGVRALRHDPSQHLRERALDPRADLRDAPAARALLRRTDVGRRGLRRVRGLRAPGRRGGRLPRARARSPSAFPEDTALGALGRYIARSDPKHYQPTNIAFGLLPELPQRDPRQGPPAPGPGRAGPRQPRAISSAGSASGESSPAPAPRPSRRVLAVQAEIAAFLRHLDRERNASPAHRPRVRRRPRAVRAPCPQPSWGATPRPQDVDHLLIRAFLARLHRAGSEVGLRRPQARDAPDVLSVSRAEKACWTATPRASLLSPRLEQAHADPSRRVETSPCWSRCPATATPPCAARAILELLYATGIRCSELVGLDLGEIDRSAPDDPRAG